MQRILLRLGSWALDAGTTAAAVRALGDRGAEPVADNPLEYAPFWRAILACASAVTASTRRVAVARGPDLLVELSLENGERSRQKLLERLRPRLGDRNL